MCNLVKFCHLRHTHTYTHTHCCLLRFLYTSTGTSLCTGTSFCLRRFFFLVTLEHSISCTWMSFPEMKLAWMNDDMVSAVSCLVSAASRWSPDSLKTVFYYTSVSGAPEAYSSHRVCLWVSEWVSHSMRDSCLHFLHHRWKLRPKTYNVSLTQQHLEMKWWILDWYSSSIVELWHDLLTSTAVACNPESSEE